MKFWKKKNRPTAIARLQNIKRSIEGIEREFRALNKEHPIAAPFLGETDFGMFQGAVSDANYALRRIMSTMNRRAIKEDIRELAVTQAVKDAEKKVDQELGNSDHEHRDAKYQAEMKLRYGMPAGAMKPKELLAELFSIIKRKS